MESECASPTIHFSFVAQGMNEACFFNVGEELTTRFVPHGGGYELRGTSTYLLPGSWCLLVGKKPFFKEFVKKLARGFDILEKTQD